MLGDLQDGGLHVLGETRAISEARSLVRDDRLDQLDASGGWNLGSDISGRALDRCALHGRPGLGLDLTALDLVDADALWAELAAIRASALSVVLSKGSLATGLSRVQGLGMSLKGNVSAGLPLVDASPEQLSRSARSCCVALR